jgi:hypothetical protein
VKAKTSEAVDVFGTRSSTAVERKAKRNAEFRANWTWFLKMPASQRNQRRGPKVNRARVLPKALPK